MATEVVGRLRMPLVLQVCNDLVSHLPRGCCSLILTVSKVSPKGGRTGRWGFWEPWAVATWGHEGWRGVSFFPDNFGEGAHSDLARCRILEHPLPAGSARVSVFAVPTADGPLVPPGTRRGDARSGTGGPRPAVRRMAGGSVLAGSPLDDGRSGAVMDRVACRVMGWPHHSGRKTDEPKWGLGGCGPVLRTDLPSRKWCVGGMR
jgi:hypothetical protein